MKNDKRKELVVSMVKDNPTLPSNTLARMIYSKNPAFFTSLERTRSLVRYYRGNCGSRCREDISKQYTNMFRENQPSGFKWVLPPTKSKPWEPFVLESKKTLIMSDIHIPFHDRKAIESFVKWGLKFKPDTVLLNGDICDFFSISRFDKNTSISSLRDEVEATRHFLGWMRDKFPKSRIIFKEGNHDEWLQKYIFKKAPEMYGLPEIELKNLLTAARENEPSISGIEWVGEQRRIRAGGLTILHGHELGKGSVAPPVNPARGAFMKGIDSILVGHLHRTSQHSERSVNGKVIECWSSGCMCGLHPEYSKINKWDQSGIALELDGNDFSLSQIRIHNGKILSK